MTTIGSKEKKKKKRQSSIQRWRGLDKLLDLLPLSQPPRLRPFSSQERQHVYHSRLAQWISSHSYSLGEFDSAVISVPHQR
jgi:hypothetical protein